MKNFQENKNINEENSIYTVHEFKTTSKEIIKITNKGYEHLLTHEEITPMFLDECIKKIDTSTIKIKDKSNISIEIKFNKIIGKTSCIKTQKIKYNEKTYFAQRIGRPYPSRVIKTQKQDCDTVTIILKPFFKTQDIPRLYAEMNPKPLYFTLITAYIGYKAEKEPWDISIKNEEEKTAALDFWCNHALIFDPETMENVQKKSYKEIFEEINNTKKCA